MGRFNEDGGDIAKDVATALYDPANGNRAVQVEATKPQFELEPQEGRLADDVDVTENGGTVQYESASVQNGLIGIETDGAQANSRGRRETAAELDYVSGLKAEAGVRVRVVTEGSATYRWGLGADGRNTQTFWKYDAAAGEMSARLERNSQAVEIPETVWDSEQWVEASTLATGDIPGWYYGYNAFDGSYVQLGSEPDPTTAFIYKIRYLWYGNGVVVFFVDAVDNAGFQRPVPVVAFVPKEQPALEQPNNPVFAEVDNAGTADQSVMSVAGRQGSRVGEQNQTERPIGHIVDSPPSLGTTGWTNVALLRRTEAGVSIPIDVVNVNVVGNDQPVDIEVRGRATPDGVKAYDDGPSRDQPVGETNLIEVEDTDVTTTAPGFLGGTGQVGTTASGQGNSGAEVGGIDEPGSAFVRREPVLVRIRSLGDAATTPDFITITANTTA